MQVKFIMILHARACNFLSYPTLHYKVWNTNVSKYKPFQIGQPDLTADSGQIVHFSISSFY